MEGIRHCELKLLRNNSSIAEIAMRMMNESNINMQIRVSCAQFSFIVKSKRAIATIMKI